MEISPENVASGMHPFIINVGKSPTMPGKWVVGYFIDKCIIMKFSSKLYNKIVNIDPSPKEVEGERDSRVGEIFYCLNILPVPIPYMLNTGSLIVDVQY